MLDSIGPMEGACGLRECRLRSLSASTARNSRSAFGRRGGGLAAVLLPRIGWPLFVCRVVEFVRFMVCAGYGRRPQTDDFRRAELRRAGEARVAVFPESGSQDKFFKAAGLVFFPHAAKLKNEKIKFEIFVFEFRRMRKKNEPGGLEKLVLGS